MDLKSKFVDQRKKNLQLLVVSFRQPKQHVQFCTQSNKDSVILPLIPVDSILLQQENVLHDSHMLFLILLCIMSWCQLFWKYHCNNYSCQYCNLRQKGAGQVRKTNTQWLVRCRIHFSILFKRYNDIKYQKIDVDPWIILLFFSNVPQKLWMHKTI